MAEQKNLLNADKARLRKLIEIALLKENLHKSHQRLDETDIYRILTTYMDSGFIILSSQRSCEAEKGTPCDDDEEASMEKTNKEQDKAIRKDLNASGFGYIPVYGGYKEKGKDGKLIDVPNPEKSYIVASEERGGGANYDKLKSVGLALIKKYNQDSFLYKPPNPIDKNAYWINQSGEKTETYKGPVKANDLTKRFFTQLRRGSNKRFSFTEEVVYWVPNSPSGMDMARRRYNEIFIGKQSDNK